MKTKLLITGFVLSVLMIAGTMGVSAAASIEIMNAGCVAPQDEYDPGEDIYVEFFCDPTGGGSCWIWVCPCIFDDSFTPQDLSIIPCERVMIDWGFGAGVTNTGPNCYNLGPAGQYGGVCECFDVILDAPFYVSYGGFGPSPDLLFDAVDADGATCADCSPTTAGGFHVTPEPAAVALFIAGLASLYGFVRMRRKK